MTDSYEPFDNWHEYTFDDACEIAALMGWTIRPRDIQFSGFWSQGDGASFTGTLGYEKGCARNVKAYAPLDSTLHDIAARWQELQRRQGYRFTAEIYRSSHHYSHENTVSINLGDFMVPDSHYDSEETALDIARDFMRWIYRQLEREYDYQRAWNMAQAWQDAAQEAHDSRAAARQAVRDYRATLASPCARNLPASTLRLSKSAIRSHLRDYASACEQFDSIAADFHYWRDGASVSIEQFAQENL